MVKLINGIISDYISLIFNIRESVCKFQSHTGTTEQLKVQFLCISEAQIIIVVANPPVCLAPC